MKSVRNVFSPLAFVGIAAALLGCSPPAASIDPVAEGDRNRAVTQQGIGTASGNPASGNRNTATTQQGLGAAGVPNPNPSGPGR